MSRYVTNSEAGTMRRCPRKWYFQYYLKIFRRRQTINQNATIGDLCHAALDQMYRLGMDPLAVIVQEAITLVAKEETGMLSATDDGILRHQENIETIGKAEQFALKMIEGYIEWLAETGADSGMTLIDSEVELYVPFPSNEITQLAGETVFMLAKMDTRWYDETTDARVFMDHKTVDQFTTREKWAHLDPQFRWYALIEMLDNQAKGDNTWTNGGIMNMLRRVKRTGSAKPPFYKRLPLTYSIHQMRTYFERVAGELMRILQTEAMLNRGVSHRTACPPSPTADCAWDCPYLQLCSMVDDGSDSVGFIETAFEVGDPLDRYETVSAA